MNNPLYEAKDEFDRSSKLPAGLITLQILLQREPETYLEWVEMDELLNCVIDEAKELNLQLEDPILLYKSDYVGDMVDRWIDSIAVAKR